MTSMFYKYIFSWKLLFTTGL